MTDLLQTNDPVATGTLAAQIKLTFTFGHDVCISRKVDGELVGGVLYTQFNGESVAIHVIGLRPRWLSRQLLAIAFDYPFNQMGVQRIFAQIADDNMLSVGLNARLGFSPVAYIPKVFKNDVGLVVTSMERSECRWLSLDVDRAYKAAA